MNIVHVIGNGFDINQGIPTSYSHFYEYYLQLTGYKDLPEAIKAFRDRLYDSLLAKETSLWSDMEKALGKDTENFNSEDDFVTVYTDVYTHLMEYIDYAYRYSRVSMFEQLDKTIYLDLMAPWEHLVPRDKTAVQKTLPNNQDYNITVLSFNYTDTLDRAADLEKKKNTIIGTYGRARCRYEGCLHIHHNLSGKDIILGVDNEDQISNPAFKTSDRVRNRLIKPQTNLGLGTMIDDDCREVIRKGDIFCLYGVSLGVTDNCWWKEIGNRMKSDLNVKVLYFPYLPDVAHVQEIEKIDIRSEKRSELKNGLGLDQKMYDNRLLVNFCNNPGQRNIFTNPKRANLTGNFENVMAMFQKEDKIIKPRPNIQYPFGIDLSFPDQKRLFTPRLYMAQNVLLESLDDTPFKSLI